MEGGGKRVEKHSERRSLENLVDKKAGNMERDRARNLPPITCHLPQDIGSTLSASDPAFNFPIEQQEEKGSTSSVDTSHINLPTGTRVRAHLPLGRNDSFKSLPLPSPRTSTASLRRFSFPKVMVAPTVDIPSEVLLVEQSPRTAEIFI